MSKRSTFIILIPAIFFILSCCSSQPVKKDRKNEKSSKKDLIFSVSSPRRNDIIRFNTSFTLNLSTSSKIIPDSVLLLEQGNKLATEKINDFSYTGDLNSKTAGRKNIEVLVYYSDSLTESQKIPVMLLPNEAPKELTYKLIRSFYHDSEAYTQGLFYYKGMLYESTGQPNRSSLRCVDPKTGEVLKKRKLEPQYFGEGIALVGNEIYMLTYQEHKGFVFNLENFEKIREFNLQTDEGWGLTTDKDKLILSDGSAYLYYFNPEYFTLENQIEICNNERLVNNLNELELTPDGLYANVYGEDYIVKINPENGVVTHTLDLSNLYPEKVQKDMDHVLNGIAYNSSSKTFYVTGKQWPVMYEIQIVAK